MAGIKENLFILTPLNFKEDKLGFEGKNVNINENVEKYDPLIFCRTCANIDSCFVPIFKDEGMYYDLNNKIEKYLPIKVSEKDDLPVQICYHCASTIIAWDNLLLGCVEAEKKLTLLKNSLDSKDCKEVEESNKDDLVIQCVDSDDEPLIAKKTGEILNKIEEKREILQEKNDLQTLEFMEVASEREKKNPPVVLSPDSSDEFIDSVEDSNLGLESHYSRFEDFDQIEKIPKEKAEPKTATREKRFFKCDICKKIFNRRYNFERHLLVHSGETLTCQACGKQYRRQSVLDRHVKVVHQQMRLANLCCNYCSKVFSSQQSLEDHFRTHTGERPFICEICGKDFRARPNLIAHKKIHTGELPYSCMLCDYRCRLKSTYVDHCQRHEGTRSCLCSVCGKGFVNNYDLMKHKKTHSKERRFSCTFCSLTFVMKRYLKVHLKTHAQKLEGVTNFSPFKNEERPAESSNSVDGFSSEKELLNLGEDNGEDWHLIPKSWLDIISCKFCGKVSSSPKHLRQHEKRGTCLKRFQCNKCGILFSREPKLLSHLKTHEKEKRGQELKKYACVICNKKFRFEDNRLAHERICGSSTFKCSECGKRFETKILADQHCESHHKSRVCHMCGQLFGKPESLKQHVKTVHEEFKMVCHYCGKDFTRKARFQEHLQRHTGQMEFTCHICGKGSTNTYAFSVHLATHTKDTPFSCSFCPRTFKHMKYVYLHERSVHLKLKSGKAYVKPKRPGKNVAKRTCPLCGKMFMRESSMLIHKRVVHEGKNGYLCKLCGKDFKYTYLLYVHKKKYHFPELCKYTCGFCKRRFPVKTELKNHLPKHTGEKPFTCNLCGKTYSFHGSLNMHMKVQHEGKKNFKCEYCESSYSFRSHLERHERMHLRKDVKIVHDLAAEECRN